MEIEPIHAVESENHPLELALGAPYPIYHGGLLHAQTLYFDPETRRPGLPETEPNIDR